VNLLKFIALLCCLVAISSTVQAGLLPDTTINHTIRPFFTVDERTLLNARLTDSAGVAEARCYFKADPDTDYLYVSMNELQSDNFQCVLPAFAAGVTKVEYFFLLINKSGQIIKSTPYLIPESATASTPVAPVNASATEELTVYSELGDAELKDISIADNRIFLTTVEKSTQLSGLRAGIYEQSEIPDSFGVMPGYFGGFILNPETNTIQPVKGFAPGMQPFTRNQAPAGSFFSANRAPSAKSEWVNIDGNNWTGYFYRTDYSGYKTYLTASISQDSYQVSITTTKSGIGNHLAGTINIYGDILVYDSYDGEDWTTHYGPASYTQVRLYDYLWAPVQGEPVPPLNVIILYRPPLPPQKVTASDGIFKDKVTVNWNVSDGATSYDIYECPFESTNNCQLLATINSNHYEDTRENYGKVYYRIKACDELCSDYSEYDLGFLTLRGSIVPALNLLL
jgi:hypothetical protein